MLDNIMIRKKRYRKSVNFCRTLPGADADHNLLAMTVRLKLEIIMKKKEAQNRWDRPTISLTTCI